MPPLIRQDTRPSIFSWWSDHNLSPTINLHAAAKPLSRFLHHRQAVEIIRNNRGHPLSSATLEIYSSYFPWDFVSWSTKAAILSELATSAAAEDDARAVVESPVFRYIAEMLESPDASVRSSSCWLLGTLASHDSTAPVILELKPCVRLLFLLGDKRSAVVREALYALCDIAKTEGGAQAIVDAIALDQVFAFLESPYVRECCRLVGRLASHYSTAPAILDPNPCERLVSLLQEPEIRSDAIFALVAISEWPDGVAGLANLDVYEQFRELEDDHSLPDDDRDAVHAILHNLTRFIVK